MDAFTTCLWFDNQGEEAAKFYTGVFPNSSLGSVTPYVGGERDGQAMTVDFVLNGQQFVALNGGPEFTFNEAISFQIPCADQAEVDRYWDPLTEGRRGDHVRLAQGQVRRLLAGCADPARASSPTQRSGRKRGGSDRRCSR